MTDGVPPDPGRYVRLHLRVGWWSILIFLSIGIGLEWLHAAKVSWYLNEAAETRRQLWTLGHAHGVMLGLVHVAFAATIRAVSIGNTQALRVSSHSLVAAGLMMPSGFLLGGAALDAGDPNPAIWLVPIGAVLLLVAVAWTAQVATHRAR